MKFRYDEAKNANLLTARGIGFEEIILEIKNGNLLSILEHHNQAKYPNQKIMQVMCLEKIYCVPYVLSDNTSFSFTKYAVAFVGRE
jgi:uncharacterized DUF497 family protein